MDKEKLDYYKGMALAAFKDAAWMPVKTFKEAQKDAIKADFSKDIVYPITFSIVASSLLVGGLGAITFGLKTGVVFSLAPTYLTTIGLATILAFKNEYAKERLWPNLTELQENNSKTKGNDPAGLKL